jgi:chemotaxis protein MotB
VYQWYAKPFIKPKPTIIMKNIGKTLLFITLSCFMLVSCVSKKKYMEATGRLNKLRVDSTQTHQQLETCNMQVNNLQGDKSTLQGQLGSMQKNLMNLNDSTSKSKMTIEQQAKRLRDLETLIQTQRSVVNNLRKTIADALVNFNSDELSVYVKDGNVYVALEERLLFKSGSAVVDPKGKEALGKLASVLNITPDISVQIEGHTDTVPIKTAPFPDNWALSTARATSIVRIITQDYKFDPHRIVASGRGEFHPVRTNATTEGKASNRRTEIIISPKLDELFAILGQ